MSRLFKTSSIKSSLALGACALFMLAIFCRPAMASTSKYIVEHPGGTATGLADTPDWERLPPRDQLLFQTDFESARVFSRIKGDKQQYRADTLQVKKADGKVERVNIFYEGGSRTGRYAKVIKEPGEDKNQVLQFWIGDAQIKGARKGYFKGRIQLGFRKMALTETFAHYRMFLHPDLEHYRSFPDENTWFTLQELWAGGKVAKYPKKFRITLGLIKPEGRNKPLYLNMVGDLRAGGPSGHGHWKAVWHSTNKEYRVPMGEWLDVAIAYRQGDRSNGRIAMAIKKASEKQYTTVFDIQDWTYHPESKKPVPLVDWHPLKLYTRGAVIDHIRAQNGAAQLYFDDLKVYRRWP